MPKRSARIRQCSGLLINAARLVSSPASTAGGLTSHRSIENSAIPSAPHGTQRALSLPASRRLHNSEPNAIPTENNVKNKVTTASRAPRIKRT